MRRWIVGVLAGLLVWTSGAASAQPTDALAVVDSLRDRGDFEGAMTLLDSLRADHGETPELLWRTAWTRSDIAETEPDGGIRQRAYRRAADEARRAVELDEESAWAQMVRGIAVGRAALDAGTRERIELSREVREAADEAIRLDDTLDGAYHIRGRWHHEVASLGFLSRNIVRVVYGGLPEASFEQAVEDFLRAVRLNDRVVHRMELGRTLLEMGNAEEARTHLEAAISMRDDDPAAPRYRQEARQLLRRIR